MRRLSPLCMTLLMGLQLNGCQETDPSVLSGSFEQASLATPITAQSLEGLGAAVVRRGDSLIAITLDDKQANVASYSSHGKHETSVDLSSMVGKIVDTLLDSQKKPGSCRFTARELDESLQSGTHPVQVIVNAFNATLNPAIGCDEFLGRIFSDQLLGDHVSLIRESNPTGHLVYAVEKPFNLIPLWIFAWDESRDWLQAVSVSTVVLDNSTRLDRVINAATKSDATLPENGTVFLAGTTTTEGGWQALPEVETELNAIQDIFKAVRPRTLQVDTSHFGAGNFTAAALKSDPHSAKSEGGLFHFASHGERPGGTQTTGYLITSDNARWTYPDIVRFIVKRATKPSLVFLSACLSVETEQPSHASLGAVLQQMTGQPVIGSLSSVRDEFMVRLSSAFYTSLTQGQNYRNALRQALLSLRKNPESADPHNWAMISMFGM